MGSYDGSTAMGAGASGAGAGAGVGVVVDASETRLSGIPGLEDEREIVSWVA